MANMTTWSCNNQCKSNCCSEVFFQLNESQRYTFENSGFFIIDQPKDIDWDYLSYHKAFNVERLEKNLVKISVAGQYERELKHNPYNDRWYLQVKNKCTELLPDNRCNVYENRPQICKIARCPVFSEYKPDTWFAEQGDLKGQILKYRNGELQKWE